MKITTVKTILLLINIFLVININNAQCKCNITAASKASLTIGGTTYYSNSITSPTIIPTITLPPGALTYSGYVSISQNVECIQMVPGDPGYYGLPCAKHSAFTEIFVTPPPIPPSLFEIGHFIGNHSTIPISTGGFTYGCTDNETEIAVYSNCNSVANSALPPGGPTDPDPEFPFIPNACPIGRFELHIIPTFTASITNECIQKIIPPSTTLSYTGSIKFKIRFSTLPPIGTTIKLYKNGVYNATISPTTFSTSTNYYFDNAGLGFGYGTYTIKYYNCAGAEIFPVGSSSTYTFLLNSKNNGCYNIIGHSGGVLISTKKD